MTKRERALQTEVDRLQAENRRAWAEVRRAEKREDRARRSVPNRFMSYEPGFNAGSASYWRYK
jgi:hypothetical protein